MEEFLVEILKDYPWFATLVMAMGTARIICKPLFSLIGSIIQSTPTKEDDAKWEAFKHSRFFKTARYLVDYLASVKIPPKSLK